MDAEEIRRARERGNEGTRERGNEGARKGEAERKRDAAPLVAEISQAFGFQNHAQGLLTMQQAVDLAPSSAKWHHK